MQYLIAFLEGIITFISPCLLPMLPIYLVYFAADAPGDGKKKKTLVNSLGFILGFTIVFVLMGAFAASIGSLLKQHQTAVNVISGLVVVIFGLNFMGLFNLKLLNGTHRAKSSSKPLGF
ncbi:MAG: cytochrome c biogenesis CcdA family protein, partial [Oscillospiraceae bacterium]